MVAAKAPTAKTTADTLPRNRLMVLMVLMVLKELSCPLDFQTDHKDSAIGVKQKQTTFSRLFCVCCGS